MKKLDPEVYIALADKLETREASLIIRATLEHEHLRAFGDIFGRNGKGGEDLYFDDDKEHRIQCLLLMAEMVRNP